MAWNDIKRQLGLATDDLTYVAAYRAAARSVPHATYRGGNFSQGRGDSGLLTSLRAFAILAANIRKVDQNYLMSAALVVARLEGTAIATDGLPRTLRAALQVCLSNSREDRLGYARQALQGCRDIFENRRSQFREADLDDRTPNGYIDVWKVAEKEIDSQPPREHGTSPVFPVNYENTIVWKRFQLQTISRDDSWGIWITWLRYRLLGISSVGIPDSIWPLFENDIALREEGFWNQSLATINITLGEMIEDLTRTAINQEVERAQAKLGLNFFVREDGIVDIADTAHISPALTQLGQELIDATVQLIESCNTNSSEELRQAAEKYRLALSADRLDGVRFVYHGSELRRIDQFQRDRDIDSNIPVLQDASWARLQSVVGLHNLLVNTSPELRELDQALNNLSAEIIPFSGLYIRKLIASTKERSAFSRKASEALLIVGGQGSITEHRSISETDVAASVTVINVIKVLSGYLWKNQKALTAGTVAAVSGIYAIGQWALANEAILMAYFKPGTALSSLVAKGFEILHALPVI
jgi:hypothetical protein